MFPSPSAAVAVVLWVAASHAQTAWEHAPRLAVVSPEKRCGKSRLMDVCEATANGSLVTVNISPATLVRSIIEDDPPALFIDEADTIFGPKAADNHEDLRGIVNSGHQRNRPPLRDLRDRLHAWLGRHLVDLTAAAPEMPLEDRAADTWEPLIAVADLAGGIWSTAARTAALTLVAAEEVSNVEASLGVRLLGDIRDLFESWTVSFIDSAELVRRLRTTAEAPLARTGSHRPRSRHEVEAVRHPVPV